MNNIPQSDSPTLLLKNLSKRFENKTRRITIFEDINTEIKRGEMVGLVAPSGTGKSTLLHIAGLLDDASEGDIIINGQSTNQLNDKQKTKLRTKTIGFVYQFHHLLPELTALENVALPLRIAGEIKNSAEQEAQELLTKMGLEHRLHHNPTEMSGGEQQRTAIARALANSPALLLADEPTGNLDPETGDKVFEHLLEAVKQNGHSALIATHNHDIAKRMDRCITIENHRLVALEL